MEVEKQLLPQLQFLGFNSGWKRKKLNELATITTGSSNRQDSSLQGEFTFFDRSQDIRTSDIFLFDGEAIIVAGEGSDFVPKYFIGKFDLHQRTYAIMDFEDSIGKFIYYYIHHHRSYFFKQAVGSTVKSLRLPMFQKMDIISPCLKEQQKIANFLTVIDNQIQTLEKKKNLLEQYKKGVMQKIFKQELRFKDKTGNVFPEWSKKKLGDLTYKVGKKNKDNIQYPIYSINNQEGFRPQSEQFDGLDSNDRGYDISLYKIVHKETFAYNPARINVGSIGYSYDLDEVIVSSLYVCFKTDKELEDLYLLAYLDTDRFNKDILRYQEGGVRQYLFYDNFSQIKIPLPSNEEQIKIANFLLVIDENIDLVNTKIEHTKSYKKGLLQQMFV
jgi:type I restriction enzyme S subunit